MIVHDHRYGVKQPSILASLSALSALCNSIVESNPSRDGIQQPG
jgi:hypothetical protein